MTLHRKSCCQKCGTNESTWTVHEKTKPVAYSPNTWETGIKCDGTCDHNVESTASVEVMNNPIACDVFETETMTCDCDMTANCTPSNYAFTTSCTGSLYAGFDHGCNSQTYSGAAPYTNKQISWNDYSVVSVADATEVDGFYISWDSDLAFGGGCTATTGGIKKATLSCNGLQVVLRFYFKAEYIWQYRLGGYASQTTSELSEHINAQTDENETWSLGIQATAGGINLTNNLVSFDETIISNGETVLLQHYRPNKCGLTTNFGFEVDPSWQCGEQADYNWDAESSYVQRTTSATWGVTDSDSKVVCPDVFSWTTSNLALFVNSATVSTS
jgi:hypothetical protein